MQRRQPSDENRLNEGCGRGCQSGQEGRSRNTVCGSAGQAHGRDDAAFDRPQRSGAGRRHRFDRCGASLRRFARHQVRDLCRAAHSRRDDRRAAQGRVAARRAARAARARSGAREAARFARTRAVAGRPRPGDRLGREAARQDDRPHQHDRIHVTVLQRRHGRRITVARGAGAGGAGASGSSIRAR